MFFFLQIQIYIVGIISFLAGLVLANIEPGKTEGKISARYDACEETFKKPRITTFILIAFYWLTASVQNRQVWIDRYGDLSKICEYFGYAWIVFTVYIIVLSIVGSILRFSKDRLSVLARLLKTGLWSGISYLFISILLNGLIQIGA